MPWSARFNPNWKEASLWSEAVFIVLTFDIEQNAIANTAHVLDERLLTVSCHIKNELIITKSFTQRIKRMLVLKRVLESILSISKHYANG